MICGKARTGQALVELAAWGGLMLIAASMLASYMMNFIYTQDVMLRNFRMAVNFARRVNSKGISAGVVHELIVHRKIPVLSFLPGSGYKEFSNTIDVTFTRNLFYKEHDDDPDVPLNLVRIVIDGHILAQEMGVHGGLSHASWLPSALVGDPIFDEVFFVDLALVDAISSDVGVIEVNTPESSSAHIQARNLGLYLSGIKEPWRDLNSSVRARIVSDINSLIVAARVFSGNDAVRNAINDLQSILQTINNNSWEGDITNDWWGEDFQEVLKGEIRINKSNRGGTIAVSHPYTEIKVFKTTHGNREINWSAGDETINW